MHTKYVHVLYKFYYIPISLRAIFRKNQVGWSADHLKISQLLHMLLILMD